MGPKGHSFRVGSHVGVCVFLFSLLLFVKAVLHLEVRFGV